MIEYEIKQEEAILRMNLLKIDSKIIEDFKKGIVHVSNFEEDIILSEERKKKIAELMRKDVNDLCIFHVIKDGTFDCVLFVSQYIDEWEWDREGIKIQGEVCSFVINNDYPKYSEMGMIFVRSQNGKLSREY